MYYNVFGEKVSRVRWKEMLNAAKNRRELIAAGLSRRDLMKMGLLTSAGYLAAKRGLSARWDSFGLMPTAQAASPPITPFVEPLPIMPIAQPVSNLNPAPTVQPNTAAGEARTRPHQALTLFPPQQFFVRTDQAARLSVHPQLPLQTLWTFNGFSPGPTFVSRYGVPILVRNFNQLPPASQNGGFGLPSVTTHLHNGHTPSESDGFPCDFFEIGFWSDQHYPNVLAGILSTHPGTGDINEALSTLWYHDHRVAFTAQNTYKGLVGYHLLFNDFDTGDETTGFHLPSFPQFDIPMVFADKVFDPTTGLLFFDTFNLDGILGDTFLVNGKVQPVLHVKPRRYRFRWLNIGPSRFLQLFLTEARGLSLLQRTAVENNGAAVPFWVIANDGNLLPKPVQATSVTIGVAERYDVIVDFSELAGQTLFIENRLKQTTGLGPDDPPVLFPGGQGNLLLKIIVSGNQNAVDQSANPANITQFYPLPDNTPTPAVTRTFKFDRLNGMFSINGQFMDCDVVRFTVTQNTMEHWLLTNLSGNWQHPIHIHLEEHQILTRNRMPPSPVEVARKDVTRLHQNERIELFFRFRDWTGRYPLHCHNTVHEDHAMMLRWEIQPEGDTNRTP